MSDTSLYARIYKRVEGIFGKTCQKQDLRVIAYGITGIAGTLKEGELEDFLKYLNEQQIKEILSE
ncbi:hypothetical protein HYW76_00275 [Candidatus Pacearchaeota archaeon]|nr:hypothetical protein [Candidatus Pacearchaeota archaeon]